MRRFIFKYVWMAALLPLVMLWGCGGSSSSPPPSGTAKSAISGTITFPSINSLVAKQVSLASTPTLEVRNLNGSVVTTAPVTGSGTDADPYRYSVTGLDSSGDYVIKASGGTQVLKALVNTGSLLPTTTRNLDTIATTTLFLAEKKLNVAPGTIGETQNSVTSSAIGDLQPAILESKVTAAVNTVLYAPATATQANVDMTNLANVVTATVYSGVNTAQFLSGTAATPVSTTQYTVATGGGASPGTATSVAAATAQSTLTDTASSYTPPVANSVSDIATVYDYNTVSTGTPLSGVTVTSVGLSPVITTTTDVDGLFVLAGIPQNASFHVKMSKAGYADAYSQTFSLTAHNDISNRPYALWLPSKLTVWGNLTGNGVIRSRVVTSTNLVNGYIGGAVVTATDQADGTPYQVRYLDSVTGNFSGTLTGTDPANGSYLVLNVPAGRIVNVTATRSGYTFDTRTFTVYADAVSEARIFGTAVATPPPTTEFPIAATSGREMSLGAAFDGTNYLVGIQGDQISGNNVTAQLVSGSTGSLVGSRISVGRTGGAPSVAFDGTNYLMIWPDDATNPNDILTGQRISTTGQLVGSRFSISASINDGGPIIFDGSNYFSVWTVASDPNSGETRDLYGQFISPSGTLIGPVIPVSTAAYGQRDPALSFDGTNILVVWTDGRNRSACEAGSSPCYESDVYGQLVTKSAPSTEGSLSGSNFLINTSSLPRDGNGVSVAFDGTNYFIIFGEETTLPNACEPTNSCKWDVFGQFVTRAGVPTGSKITINNSAANHKFAGVSWNGTRYLVTWTENFAGPATSIKGRYFDTSGAPVGSELTLFTTASDGRIPWYAIPIVNGSNYFTIVSRGIPGIDPFNFDAYTSQDVYGKFITP